MLARQHADDRDRGRLVREALTHLQLQGLHAVVIVEYALHEVRPVAVLRVRPREHEIATEHGQRWVAAQGLQGLPRCCAVTFRNELELVLGLLQEIVVGAPVRSATPTLGFRCPARAPARLRTCSRPRRESHSAAVHGPPSSGARPPPACRRRPPPRRASPR